MAEASKKVSSTESAGDASPFGIAAGCTASGGAAVELHEHQEDDSIDSAQSCNCFACAKAKAVATKLISGPMNYLCCAAAAFAPRHAEIQEAIDGGLCLPM